MRNSIFCMDKNGWRLTKALAIFVVLVGLLSSATAQSNHYFYQYESPDAVVYLPAPPDTSSLLFAHDFNRWIWGKSLRNTPRGEQASWESLYGMERFSSVFGEALDIEISKEKTPALWKFIQRAAVTGDSAVKSAKVHYMRVRPFARMGEHVFGQFDDEEGLRHNGSYPSGHTATGWAIALALAEMAPELQDTILRRGFEYGQSRVIVGAHWQSDVDAGRLASSAAFARMHTSPDFAGDLAAARAEFLKLRPEMAKQQPGYPNGNRILDEPVTAESRFFYGDVAAYWVAKAERGTERGRQAISDNELNSETMCKALAGAAGVSLSNGTTPNTIALLTWTSQNMDKQSRLLKEQNPFRQRPYVLFDEPTLIPAEEQAYADNSSYPSITATTGWGIALVMIELMPERQNELLKCGYEIGYSRVVAGYHYASDVQAGRVLAACVLAHMHTDPVFVHLLELAKTEWE